jgi:hypothetical protein
MSNQVSTIPFGTNATKLSGYLYRFGDRLGNFDILIENTGKNDLYFVAKEQTDTSSSGSFIPVCTPVTVVPKGLKTISLNVISKKIGFFGSGNTIANVQITFRNPSNLSGSGWDLVVTGHRGWGYDPGLSDGDKAPTWPDFNTLF